MEKHVKNGINYSDDSYSKLDLDYYDSIKTVARFCLCVSFWTAAFTFANVVSLIGVAGSGFAIFTTLLEGTLFVVLGCWAYYALKHRKPNALFLARALLVMCILSWVLLVLMGGFEITMVNLIFGLGTLFWGSYGLYLTYSSEEMHAVFPKEYRKTGALPIAYVCIMVLWPFFIGLILGAKESVFSDRARLERVVSAISDSCPLSGDQGELTDVLLEDNQVIFFLKVPDQAYQLYANQKTSKIGRKYALSYVAFIAMIQSEGLDPHNSPEEYGLAALMIKEKTPLKMKVFLKDTSESIVFDYSSAEVIDYLSTIQDSKQALRKMLEISIEIMNICPIEIEEGITLTRSSVEDDYLILYYIINEDLYDIYSIRDSEADIKANTLQDPGSSSIILKCKYTGTGLVLRYVGSETGEIADVIILNRGSEG